MECTCLQFVSDPKADGNNDIDFKEFDAYAAFKKLHTFWYY